MPIKTILRNSISILFFILLQLNSYGQKDVRRVDIMMEMEPIILKNRVDSLIESSDKNKTFELSAKIASEYATVQYNRKNYSEGYTYAQKIISYLKMSNVDYKIQAKVFYDSAILARMDSDFIKAMEYFDRSLELNPTDQMLAQVSVGKGYAYYSMGDYEHALIYLEKGAKLYQKMGRVSSAFRTYTYIFHAGLKIADSTNIDKGLDELQRLNKLRSLIKVNPTTSQQYYLMKANLYNLKGAKFKQEARKNYFSALEFAKIKGDIYEQGKIYNDLSYLYLRNGGNDSAKFYSKKAIKLIGNEPINLSVAYQNYINALIRNEEYSNVILVSDTLILMNYPNWNRSNKFSVKRMSNIKNRNSLLSGLKSRILSFIYLSRLNNEKEYLNSAIEDTNFYDGIVLEMNQGFQSESSQLFWRTEASQAYLYGTYATHLLKESSRAFSFMEKSKALLLSEGVLKNTEFANLPRHISQQETAFQKQIYELENKLSKDEENVVLQDSLFVSKQTHEQYVDSLKTVYPKYFARKINVDQISLEEVQQELGNKGAVLSYIWNDFDRDTELIIGLVATKDQAQTFEIKNVKELRENLSLYRKLISQPFTTKEEQDSFQKVTYQLYSLLLPNEEVRNLIKGKNLTIIPDGDLQNIPFESLITEENSHEYFILNGDINYSYSYSFLKHNEKVDRNTEQTFIGYSPNTFEGLSLSDLKNSKQEVLNINNQFEGIAKLQDTATKEDFLNNSSDAKIIHLATHADVGKNPWIAFSDEKLELHELYTFKNNADLVTLSACNTSLGELAKGEGVLSLARGFFYAGSKSVVSSLWNVNDKSTSEIMTNFYQNLKSGQTKSEALNKAKRNYLTSHSLSEQSPYYWSSFILIGDPGNIDLPSNHYVYFLVALLIAAVILLFRKKIKISG